MFVKPKFRQHYASVDERIRFVPKDWQWTLKGWRVGGPVESTFAQFIPYAVFLIPHGVVEVEPFADHDWSKAPSARECELIEVRQIPQKWPYIGRLYGRKFRRIE